MSVLHGYGQIDYGSEICSVFVDHGVVVYVVLPLWMLRKGN